MEVVKRFENELGYAELQKYDKSWVAVLHSDFALVSHFVEYRFKQEAIEMFQFYNYWLTSNNRNN